MRVGVMQFDVAHESDQNLNRLEFYLKQHPCDIAVLPELSMCGYLFANRKELQSCAEMVPSGRSTQRILALSQQYSCTVIFGLAEKDGDSIFNTAVVVSKGRYIGKYRKIHLSDFEKKLFDRGIKNEIFEVDGMKIGIQICFDLWFPEISREQLRMGADFFCVLANFGGETTYHISRIRAIENLTPLALCNRIGSESIPELDAEFLGKSTVIHGSGQQLYLAPEKEEDFGLCDMEIAKINANVICGDFDKEISFHYQTPFQSETSKNGG